MYIYKGESGLFKHLFPLRIPILPVAMLIYKTFVVFIYLCLVHEAISKPTSGNEVAEGRGVLSSIWGWITYPFSWWHASDSEQPVTGQLVGSTTTDANDIVDIRSHNVTIWCNDQTCTTMKCDYIQCRNITCNIYETDFRGECREYNIITDLEQDTVQKVPETTPKVNVHNIPIQTPNTNSNIDKTPEDKDIKSAVEDHPLELEAVLSSTVSKQSEVEHSDTEEASTMHQTPV